MRARALSLVLACWPVLAAHAAPDPRAAPPGDDPALVAGLPGPDAVTLGAAQARVRALPDSLPAWEALGRAWVRQARSAPEPAGYQRAHAVVLRLRALSSNHSSEADRLELLVAQATDRPAAVARAAAELVRREPRDALAWGAWGDALCALGDYGNAALAYQGMLSLAPSLPAFARAAALRGVLGDDEGADAMWAEAIAAGSPRDPEPFVYVLGEAAQSALWRGAFGLALALSERALAVLPSDADAAEVRDDALVALGYRAARVAPETDRAEALADALTQREQRADILTRDALAVALGRVGDCMGALDELDQALAFGTRDMRLFSHQALLAWDCGLPVVAATAARTVHDTLGSYWPAADAWPGTSP